MARIVRRYADRTEHYGDVFLGILTHEVLQSAQRRSSFLLKLRSRRSAAKGTIPQRDGFLKASGPLIK